MCHVCCVCLTYFDLCTVASLLLSPHYPTSALFYLIGIKIHENASRTGRYFSLTKSH
ncbi:hypothetical protein PUN28_009240 [Cardiocondyla obscurior]|uniref:Uncharacterized protein n=1 Tax=Cardiocondyla obscurior TaxID=286306 RepID=A0AAW2FTH5_9HYME